MKLRQFEIIASVNIKRFSPISVKSDIATVLNSFISTLLLKRRISPFLFLKDKLFELYGIFTVAFIKYKKY